MGRPKKKIEGDSVVENKLAIEVGKSTVDSVESKIPNIHESKEDLTYDRPDPLAVKDLKGELRPYWGKDDPDSINKLARLGYVPAKKEDFTNPSSCVKTYGDLRLMVCQKENFASREKSRQTADRTQEREETKQLKGYVSGHAFN